MDAFESVALPFEDDWSGSERRTAVAAYARLFLGSLLRGGSSAAHQGLVLMLETRWAPLLDSFVPMEERRQTAAAAAADCAAEGEDVCPAAPPAAVEEEEDVEFSCSLTDLTMLDEA